MKARNSLNRRTKKFTSDNLKEKIESISARFSLKSNQKYIKDVYSIKIRIVGCKRNCICISIWIPTRTDTLKIRWVNFFEEFYKYLWSYISNKAATLIVRSWMPNYSNCKSLRLLNVLINNHFNIPRAVWNVAVFYFPIPTHNDLRFVHERVSNHGNMVVTIDCNVFLYFTLFDDKLYNVFVS